MATRQQTQDAYRSGRSSYTSGKDKDSCPFGNSELNLKHWWLAGWNDKDMELDK